MDSAPKTEDKTHLVNSVGDDGSVVLIAKESYRICFSIKEVDEKLTAIALLPIFSHPDPDYDRLTQNARLHLFREGSTQSRKDVLEWLVKSKNNPDSDEATKEAVMDKLSELSKNKLLHNIESSEYLSQQDFSSLDVTFINKPDKTIYGYRANLNTFESNISAIISNFKKSLSDPNKTEAEHHERYINVFKTIESGCQHYMKLANDTENNKHVND